MSDGYEILSLDDLERYTTTQGTQVLRPLRRHLGFRPFGVNLWTADAAGDHVIERHREPTGVEELYVVVRGTVRFTLGKATFDAPAGTLVHAPAGTLREGIASEPGVEVLAIGAKPGQAFEPSAWEDFYVAYALLRAGEPARGRAAIAEALAREPDAWQGAFNAACYEALAGEPEAALGHLQRSLELDARETKRHAQDDADLDSLRSDPRFQELVG